MEPPEFSSSAPTRCSSSCADAPRARRTMPPRSRSPLGEREHDSKPCGISRRQSAEFESDGVCLPRSRSSPANAVGRMLRAPPRVSEHRRQGGVRDTQRDHADISASRQCGDLGEVEVERHDDSILDDALGKDLPIRHSLETLLAKVHRFVTLLPQPDRRARVDSHVEQEAHDEFRTPARDRASAKPRTRGPAARRRARDRESPRGSRRK